MKPINKIIFSILIVTSLVFGGYLTYHFTVSGDTFRLAPPEKIPFFSVYYAYYLQPESFDKFRFGTQIVPALELSNVITSDMINIKSMGFEGIKLSFHFKSNNYISDRIALKAAQNGLYPVGILMGNDVKPRDRAFNESEMAEWKDFVRTEVRTNKNTIYFWEIWNEPTLEELFRYGTPGEYVELLKITSKIIKEENPDAKVIVTLDAAVNGTKDFSESVLAMGGGNYFDILSFHPYAANPYIREDIFNRSVDNIRAISEKYSNKWPLWVTEIGQPESEVGEERQAELTQFVFQRLYDEHIPLVWLCYSDQRLALNANIGEAQQWGLLDENGSPKKSFYVAESFMQQANIGAVTSS